MTKKTDYERVLDLIRSGLTSKQLKENKEALLRASISPEFIELQEKILKEVDSDKLKVTCTEEDKKRIIKEEYIDLVKAGYTPKFAEKQIKEWIKEGDYWAWIE